MKDQNIGYLISLLNGRMERFDRSRNIQWKLNGSLWAGLVVVIGFIQLNADKISLPCWSVVLTGVIISIIHTVTIINMQRSLDWDKGLIRSYNDTINGLIGSEAKNVVKYIKKVIKKAEVEIGRLFRILLLF